MLLWIWDESNTALLAMIEIGLVPPASEKLQQYRQFQTSYYSNLLTSLPTFFRIVQNTVIVHRHWLMPYILFSETIILSLVILSGNRFRVLQWEPRQLHRMGNDFLCIV